MGILKLGPQLTVSCRYRIVIFVCLTALLCVAAGLLGNYFLYGESAFAPLSLVLVDEDDSLESRMLLGYLEELEGYEDILLFSRQDASTAAALLEQGSVTAAITIPPGFIAGVMDGSNQPFRVALSASSPLRAGLVRLFADAYAGMLRTGQTGVYTALDAAWNQGGDAYQEMHRLSNLRYLTAMLNRSLSMETREVSATGSLSPGVHYAAAALVFLLLLGSVLFLDVWAAAAARPVLLRLRALGKRPLVTGLCYCASAFVPFAAVLLLLGAGIAAVCAALGLPLPLGGWLALCGLLLVLCAGAFLFAASRLAGGSAAGVGAVFVFSLAGLFLSGGILPSAYLSPLLQTLGRFTPHYWLVRLLTQSLAGQAAPGDVVPVLVWIGLLALVGVAGVLKGGKVGDRP